MFSKANQHPDDHKKDLGEKLNTQAELLYEIFTTSPNIKLIFNGTTLEYANEKMLQFFGIASVEEFVQKYQCISTFFLKENDYLFKEMPEGQDWFHYLLEHPQEQIKVILLKDNQRYIFAIDARELFSGTQKSYIVDLEDITTIEEMRQRYSFAINGADVGLWDWNLLTNEV